MLPRFHLSDLSTVGHHIGTLVVLTGILMCIPLAVALLFGEYASAVDFVFGIGCCTLLGAALRLFKARRVDRRCSLLLTGFSWIAVGLMAAIPMFLSGGYGSFTDALFDSVSSITTTGASLAASLDTMSYSQVVWHAVLTLAGGQAVIVIAIYMGFFGEGSFAAVATTRGYSDLMSIEFARSTRAIWAVTALLTGAGTIVAFGIGLWIGLTPASALVDAFCLAANAANTGGFVPHTSSLVYYHNVGIDGFVLVLITLGAINLGIFGLAMKGRWKDIRLNSELRALAAWTTVFIVIISVGFARDGVYTTLSGLVDRGMFMSIAGIATSGMQTVYPEQLTTCFSDGVLILLMLAIFLGASACSTAGGVKILRVMEVLRWFGYTIFRAILPDSARMKIRYNYFGNRTMTPTDATRAMTIMILYLVATALGAMAFIAHGNDALPSILESISYVCNSGITVGIMSPTAPFDLKLIAIAQMWAGRLEFIALIAAIAGIIVSLRPLPPNAGGGRASKAHRARSRATSPLRRMGKNFFQRTQEKRAQDKAAQGERTHKEHPTHHKRVEEEADRPTGGFARVLTLAVAAVLALSLAAAPFAASAARSDDTPGQGGATVPASQIDSLQSETVESYREMSVRDLLGATERLDERRVQITGAVYGSPIRGGKDTVWINVKQDSAMIGVNMSSALAEKIGTFGGYWQTGDTVTISGVFHRACVKHHGELDVHATQLTLSAESKAVDHPVRMAYLGIGLVLFALGVGEMFLKRLLYGNRKRKRKFLGLV